MRLYPPLLFIPGQGSSIIGFDEKAEAKDENILSLDRIYPLLTQDFTPLVETLRPGSRKITAVMRVYAGDTDVKTQDITAVLRRGDSPDTVPLSLSVLEIKEGGATDTILAELDLPELEPGDYTLEIKSEDKTTGAAASVTRILRVR